MRNWFFFDSDTPSACGGVVHFGIAGKYLEKDIATYWKVKDKRGDEIELGIHRRFLIRSSDRIRDRQLQRKLQNKWTALQSSIEANKVLDYFLRQENYPKKKGTLRARLEDALGLKLLAQLPDDPCKRNDLLLDIIDAAVPIALWLDEMAVADTSIANAEFDSLLKEARLTNFASLAKQWRKRRVDSVVSVAKHIRLLCDCPHRLPKLPDIKNQEDKDAIVAP